MKATHILALFVVVVQLVNWLPIIVDCSIGTPVQVWVYGGCGYACDVASYSSPAVANLSGRPVVLGASYSFYAVDGQNGSTIWSTNGNNRLWADVVLADLTGDGVPEVITGQNRGAIVNAASLATGASVSGWPVDHWQDSSIDCRAVAAADLDGDGTIEVVAGHTAGNSPYNTIVFNNNGGVRNGWPRPESASDGIAAGIYNDNFAIANMDSTPHLEVIVPSDVHYVCAYHDDGTPVSINSSYFNAITPTTVWGNVGFCSNGYYERNATYCPCNQANPSESTRSNFANEPVTVADVDGNGVNELIFTGTTYYFYDSACNTGSYSNAFIQPYITNMDRTRWSNPSLGYDWFSVPNNFTAPLSAAIETGYSVLQSSESNPVVADLDGDGQKEILFSAFDGKLHAFWLDKTEHGDWPYVVSTLNDAPNLKYSSPPIVVDLDNDGKAEVIVSTWTSYNTNTYGELLILSWDGRLLQSIGFPGPHTNHDGGLQDWGGGLASPTIAQIDPTTPDYEVVVMTAQAGLCCYRIPGSANARILWGTGRGNYQRTGSVNIPVAGNPTNTATASKSRPAPSTSSTASASSVPSASRTSAASATSVPSVSSTSAASASSVPSASRTSAASATSVPSASSTSAASATSVASVTSSTGASATNTATASKTSAASATSTTTPSTTSVASATSSTGASATSIASATSSTGASGTSIASASRTSAASATSTATATSFPSTSNSLAVSLSTSFSSVPSFTSEPSSESSTPSLTPSRHKRHKAVIVFPPIVNSTVTTDNLVAYTAQSTNISTSQISVDTTTKRDIGATTLNLINLDDNQATTIQGSQWIDTFNGYAGTSFTPNDIRVAVQDQDSGSSSSATVLASWLFHILN